MLKDLLFRVLYINNSLYLILFCTNSKGIYVTSWKSGDEGEEKCSLL